MDRLGNINGALSLSKEEIKNNESIRNKDQWFKVNGWGYKDTEFVVNEDGTVHISGNRYAFSGQKMPKFKEWAETVIGIDVSNPIDPQKDIPIDPQVENLPFIESIKGKVDEINSSKLARINHSHGHSLQELFMLRNSKLPRTADYVVYIINHDQAEHLIKMAEIHNVVLIPYGGYFSSYVEEQMSHSPCSSDLKKKGPLFQLMLPE